jgi:capsular polysaccharide transport system permease protein
MMLRSPAARQTPTAPPAARLPTQPSSATVRPLPFLPRPYNPAHPTTQQTVSLRTLSFFLIVLLPIMIAAIYYLAIAADQYVAEFRLSLRSVDTPQIQPLLLFGSDATRTTASTESQIVTQFIASRAIIDELDPTLDLRRIFSPPEADWWARLWLPASIEQLVYYWQKQIDPFYDTSTGTITVRVRAFNPAELRLAQAIVRSSEQLINELSVRARRDAVDQAEREVTNAEMRLRAALAAIRDFRDKEGLIDPAKAADATANLSNKLRDELVKANSELATLKTYMHDDAPSVRVLKARIRSLEAQQHGLVRELTASSPPQPAASTATPALSQSLGSYEPLDAERKFAEASYQHALEGLDRARDNADRQHIYVESFVPPSLPEMALYPHRWRSIGVVALISFGLWAIGGLAVQSIRDHL